MNIEFVQSTTSMQMQTRVVANSQNLFIGNLTWSLYSLGTYNVLSYIPSLKSLDKIDVYASL